MPEKMMDASGKRRKSIMRTFKIDEISAVDSPAQAGARAVILKRGDATNETLDLFEEAHPRHGVSKKAGSGADGGNSSEEGDMPIDDNAAAEHLAELEKRDSRISELEKILSLSTEERAHYDKMDDAGKEKFLAASSAGRSMMIAKALDHDAVVYTSDNGDEFRKSDDPRLVKMARERDEERRQVEKYRRDAEHAELSKRANDELGCVPGSTLAKVEILRAVSMIDDEKTRVEVEKILKACDKVFKMVMTTRGSSLADETIGASPSEQLEAAVRKIAEKDGVDEGVAYAKYLETPDGKRLYDACRQERLTRN